MFGGVFANLWTVSDINALVKKGQFKNVFLENRIKQKIAYTPDWVTPPGHWTQI